MKSVLHVALNAPGLFSSEPFMKAFMDNGFDTYYLFDWQLEMFTHGREKMQHRLVEEAEKRRPDLIFMHVQSSEIIDIETAKRLSKISFTVNYTFDIRSTEQTEWLYQLVREIGLVCFSNQRDVDACTAAGYRNVMVLQSSCDMEMYKPSEEVGRGNMAVFIGNNTSLTPLNFPKAMERQQMVEVLKKGFSDRFHLYGMGWGMRFLMQKEEIESYQSHTIAVCHNQFQESLYTSDRLWRAMSCGAFCLTKKFEGIHTIFTRGLHLDWWESFDELTEQLHYYLDNPEHTQRIALNGMRHVRLNHNWTRRIAQLMYVINSKITPVKNDCVDAHRVGGVIPEPFHQQFDGQSCDCGKLKWVWEECGCSIKQYQLRAYENIV